MEMIEEVAWLVDQLVLLIDRVLDDEIGNDGWMMNDVAYKSR